MPKVLLTSPCFDAATIFGYWWKDKTVTQSLVNGYETLDLKMGDAVRDVFESAIQNFNPEVFYGYGHGNAELFTGQNKDILLHACYNDHLMSGRIVYLLSCTTGQKLGPSMVNKGARAYIGYDDYFVWADYDLPPGGFYHGCFYDFSNVIIANILYGNPVSVAVERALERAYGWIDYLSSLEDDPLASKIIEYLLHDRNSLVSFGDKSAQIQNRMIDYHIGSIFLAGFSPLELSWQDVKFRVAVVCHVDHCDFSNKALNVYDPNGNLISSADISYFGSGINVAEIFIPWSSIQQFTGTVVLTLILEPDELHPAIMGFVELTVNPSLVDVCGYIYEVSLTGVSRAGGASIGLEPVYWWQKGGGGATANSEGWYEIKQVPPGVYWHIVEYKGLSIPYGPGAVGGPDYYVKIWHSPPRLDKIRFDEFWSPSGIQMYVFPVSPTQCWNTHYPPWLELHHIPSPLPKGLPAYAEEMVSGKRSETYYTIHVTSPVGVIGFGKGFPWGCQLALPYDNYNTGVIQAPCWMPEGVISEHNKIGLVLPQTYFPWYKKIEKYDNAVIAVKSYDAINLKDIVGAKVEVGYRRFLIMDSAFHTVNGVYARRLATDMRGGEEYIEITGNRYIGLRLYRVRPDGTKIKLTDVVACTEFWDIWIGTTWDCPKIDFDEGDALFVEVVVSPDKVSWKVIASFISEPLRGKYIFSGKWDIWYYITTEIVNGTKKKYLKLVDPVPDHATHIANVGFVLEAGETDEYAYFCVDNLPLDNYFVSVSKPGYRKITVDFPVNNIIFMAAYLISEGAFQVDLGSDPQGIMGRFDGRTFETPASTIEYEGRYTVSFPSQFLRFKRGCPSKIEALKFSKWSDDQLSPTREIYLTSDLELFAYFEERSILSLSSSVGGYLSIEPGMHVFTKGETVEIEATPIAGNQFLGWIVDEEWVTDNPLVLNMDRNYNVLALFSPTEVVKCRLTIRTTTGGTTDPAPGEYTYPKGTEVTVTAVPYTGYEFNHWILDGQTRTENPLTIVMDRDYTLTAYFEVVTKEYTLTINTTTGGTTDPSPGTYKFPQGTKVVIKAIPSSGYEFDYWQIDTVATTTQNPITVIMDRNYTLTAYFKPLPAEYYSLTISTTTGGTTKPPPGKYTYPKGTVVSVEAIPYESYEFNHWLLDGQVRVDNPISITINSDYDLTAYFRKVEEARPPPPPTLLYALLGLCAFGLVYYYSQKGKK